MTSPEGRLRCGRPSAFVPASLQSFLLRSIPTSVPLRFSPSDSRPRKDSSSLVVDAPPPPPPPSLRLLHIFPLLFLSAQLSLPRSGLTSCQPLSICPIGSCLAGPSFYLSIPPERTSPPLPPTPPSSVFLRLPIFDSFDPETRQALLCIGNSFMDVWSNMFYNQRMFLSIHTIG